MRFINPQQIKNGCQDGVSVCACACVHECVCVCEVGKCHRTGVDSTWGKIGNSSLKDLVKYQGCGM